MGDRHPGSGAVDDFAIVSASDARYFGLLRNLLSSIRSAAPSPRVPVCVIDLGLSPGSRDELASMGVTVATARNDFGVALTREMPGYVMAFLSRPWLPEYFPGFETYVWMDADTHLQDWRAVELYLRGARRGALAITPETDRAYGRLSGGIERITLRFGRPWKIKHWLFARSRAVYERSEAELLLNRQLLNSGVFALRRDAPHWKHWRESLRVALSKGRYERWIVGCDQLSLNHAVYTRSLTLELLPAVCNWNCSHALPAVDSDTGLLVEPYLPHAVIGVVHVPGMSVEEATRLRELATTAGATAERRLIDLARS
jgi:hypothetical protein